MMMPAHLASGSDVDVPASVVRVHCPLFHGQCRKQEARTVVSGWQIREFAPPSKYLRTTVWHGLVGDCARAFALCTRSVRGCERDVDDVAADYGWRV